MIWEVLGHINGKALLVGLIAAAVGIALTLRRDK